MEEYPTLGKLFEDLTRLTVHEESRRRAAGRPGRPESVTLAEGRDTTTLVVPWLPDPFWFVGGQREVVRQLVSALVRGNPEVREVALLHLARARCRYLSELFGGHPAWGVAIVRGSKSDTYRICPPPSGGTAEPPIVREPVE